MRVKSLFAVILLCVCTTITFAQQDQSFKTITVAAGIDTTFDKIIDYLQAKDIFIQAVDKQGGFIQGRLFVKQNKILSAKSGERKTMSFILRPAGDQTRVTLNIYLEQYYFGGDVSARTYYFEDKGIVDDPTVYRDILISLQKAVDL